MSDEGTISTFLWYIPLWYSFVVCTTYIEGAGCYCLLNDFTGVAPDLVTYDNKGGVENPDFKVNQVV